MANTLRTPDRVQIATGQIATGQIDPAVIRTAIDQARQSARQIGDLQAVNGRTIRTLETALDQSIRACRQKVGTGFAQKDMLNQKAREGGVNANERDPL